MNTESAWTRRQFAACTEGGASAALPLTPTPATPSRLDGVR
jgi:hypothetical protein